MTTTTSTSPVALVPGERFFLKEIALDPTGSAAAQVELGIEEASPFPLSQLYHGFVVSPDRRVAVAFAAYRRRFTGEELAEWPGAAAVLPEFLALVGPAPDRPTIVVQVQPAGLNAVAWDGRAGLPVAFHSRTVADPTEAQITEVVTELRRRAGLTEAEVRRLEGPAGVGLDAEGNAIFRLAGEETARLSATALAHADVRDKSFLDEKRRDADRRRRWARAFSAIAALLAVAIGLDLAAVGVGLWNRQGRSRVAARADDVHRVETAQALATRIEDLAARQEKPLEWLSIVSAIRPRSVQFTRVESGNDRSLLINAQTVDASAVGAYETALRQRTELEQVETRDLRSREGMTSFVLYVKFQPGGGAATQGGQP